MKAIARRAAPFLIATLAALVASCSQPQRVEPAPAPSPTVRPQPRPAPLPPPSVDWREHGRSPGDWAWSMEDGHSTARFAGGALTFSCDRIARTVTMTRAGAAQAPVAMTVLTSSQTRPLTGEPVAGPPAALAVTFPARDPLLDAMAFSRGHFAVETAGLETLYPPSWPEIARVIEDCR